MMKWAMPIVLIASVIVIPALGEDRIKEGFEGPVFPPRAWTTYTYGTGNGNWSRELIVTGHRARGAVSCSSGYYYGAELATPYMPLTVGDTLTLFCDINNGGATLGGNMFITLCTVGSDVWSECVDLPQLGEAVRFTYNLPYITFSANYQLRWIVEAAALSYPGGAGIVVSLDNITVDRNSGSNLIQTEPCSLGRIKSTYK